MVVGTGNGVTQLQVGNEVWSDVGFSGLIPGAHGMGAWADYVVAKEEIVSLKPASLPHSVAGALPLVALTAFQSMVTAGAPWDSGTSNISVVITSGDGGTGSLGVQLAKKMGATMVRTCAAPDHVSYGKVMIHPPSDQRRLT